MLSEEVIFNHLFDVAKDATDPEGVVTSCLVKGNQILLSSPSAEDGVRHAEDLLIEEASKQNINLSDEVVLYTTLEPCSRRNPKHQIKDCTSIIIESGICSVIFGAKDPNYSEDAKHRITSAGIKYQQTENDNLVRKSLDNFNGTITDKYTYEGKERAISIDTQ